MDQSLDVAAFGAAAAALGFIGKMNLELIVKYRDKVTERRSRLVALQSNLLASRSVFLEQKKLLDTLYKEILSQKPGLAKSGYDDVLAAGFADLSNEQRMVHGLGSGLITSSRLRL